MEDSFPIENARINPVKMLSKTLVKILRKNAFLVEWRKLKTNKEIQKVM